MPEDTVFGRRTEAGRFDATQRTRAIGPRFINKRRNGPVRASALIKLRFILAAAESRVSSDKFKCTNRSVPLCYDQELDGLLPSTDGSIQWIRSGLGRISCASWQQSYSPGLFIIGGASESHLESIRECILGEYRVEADVYRPKVIYLETIRKQAEAEGEFIYQHGKVKLQLEPLEERSGYQFIDEITDGAFPPEFIEPVNSAIQEAMKAGILAGQEIVDLRAVLCDGSYHREDSNESAFKIAAAIAFKEAVR
jgi:hypothetical protein